MSPALLPGSYSNDLTGNTQQYQTQGAWEQAQNGASNNQAYNFKQLGGKRRRTKHNTRKSKRSKKSRKSRKSKKSCGCKKIALW